MEDYNINLNTIWDNLHNIKQPKKGTNMKKLENIKTETYKYNNVVWIDIIETEELYEAYLYDHDYDTKWYMFGMPKEQQTKEEFIEIVEYNVPEYMEDYEEIVYKNSGGYKCEKE